MGVVDLQGVCAFVVVAVEDRLQVECDVGNAFVERNSDARQAFAQVVGPGGEPSSLAAAMKRHEVVIERFGARSGYGVLAGAEQIDLDEMRATGEDLLLFLAIATTPFTAGLFVGGAEQLYDRDDAALIGN